MSTAKNTEESLRPELKCHLEREDAPQQGEGSNPNLRRPPPPTCPAPPAPGSSPSVPSVTPQRHLPSCLEEGGRRSEARLPGTAPPPPAVSKSGARLDTDQNCAAKAPPLQIVPEHRREFRFPQPLARRCLRAELFPEEQKGEKDCISAQAPPDPSLLQLRTSSPLAAAAGMGRGGAGRG